MAVMTTLLITRNSLEAMITHLTAVYPVEGCGFMAGQAGCISHVYPVDNTLASPFAFEMVPEQLVAAMIDIEKQGLTLLAIYHSHPQGPPAPSPMDIAQANYPETIQVIVSFQNQTQPKINAFQIKNGEVHAVPLEVV